MYLYWYFISFDSDFFFLFYISFSEFHISNEAKFKRKKRRERIKINKMLEYFQLKYRIAIDLMGKKQQKTVKEVAGGERGNEANDCIQYCGDTVAMM